ncbi:MAG: tetratricopeptide repeat protein [bacterium]|nr:MAG: tetratricopeptide repeat protein [bacterium]
MRKIYSVVTLSLLVLVLAFMLFGCRSKEVESALIYINQQNDWDKAMEQLELAVQANPADVEAHVYLGEGYGRRGEYQKMNEHYDTAMKLMEAPGKANKKFIDKINFDHDKFWRESFNKGVQKVKSEKLADAAINFQNCIIIDAERPEAYRNLGYVDLQNDNIESAIKNYEEVIRINPQDTETMADVGRLYMRIEQFDKSIEMMDRILAVDSLNVDAIAQKAMAYDYLGESEKAFAAYEDALVKRPDDTDLLFNLGRLFFMKEEYEKAIEYFNKVIEKDPEDFESNLNIGNAYLSLAQNVLKKERDMSSEELAKIPAKELHEKKDQETEYYKKSIPYLEKAAELKPNDASVWNNLGVAYVNIGEEEKGKEAFDKAEALQK